MSQPMPERRAACGRVFSLSVLLAGALFSSQVQAAGSEHNRLSLQLGAQASRWDLLLEGDDPELQGRGWQLAGNLPISRDLSLTGYYSRLDYEPEQIDLVIAELTQWQLGGHWQAWQSSSALFALEYRYVDMELDMLSGKKEDEGHSGLAHLQFFVSGRGYQATKRGALELVAGQTAYRDEERWQGGIGYRAYVGYGFSFGLHYLNEDDDRHLLTLSIREEK